MAPKRDWGQVDVLILQEGDESVASMRERLKAATTRRTTPGKGDSVEKILGQLALVAKHEVSYEGKRLHRPSKVVGLTPSMFRSFYCVAGCTACCVAITLDYIPLEMPNLPEEMKQEVVVRPVVVNGQTRNVFTSDQREASFMCGHLTAVRPDGGLGCGLFPQAPLSCVSAPQFNFIQRGETTLIMKRGFTRGWRMALKPHCEFGDIGVTASDEDLLGDIAIIDRYIKWAAYFEIETALPEVREHMLKVIEGVAPKPLTSVLFPTGRYE